MRWQGKVPPALGPVLLVVLLGGGDPASSAENIDPAGDGHQFAWGENVGWINAEPSNDGGQGIEVTDFKLRGWFWGENIGWINASCENNGTCDTGPFGIANDGFGALTGFAWGENVGWINVSPSTCLPDPACGVRINPATGYFRGMAWGENIGWINFSSPGPEAWTVRTSWCQSTAGPPGFGPVIRVSKSAATGVLLSWTPLQSASWYDVVGGKLSSLRASRGNFSVSTDQCLTSKTVSTSSGDPSQTPGPSDGVWYLVRGSNCKGRGTYDTGQPSQIGSRDAEIAASGHDCP